VVFQNKLLNRDLIDFMRNHAKNIQLPPLRERKKDIIPIVYDLLENLNEKYHQQVFAIEPKAQKLLTHYYWPGNIDELKQVITAIFSRYSGMTTITAEHLPEHIKNSKIPGSKYLFELKGNERFLGKIRSRSLRVQSTLQHHATHRIDTRKVVKIIREEDTRFAPPKMKHFALTLKDGSHLPVMILDKTITVETSFDPSYQINVQDVHEVVLS
jgi:transcriptional regulator with PAS, ATPase and Fis domain